MDLSEGAARRFVTEVLGSKEPLAGVSEASPEAEVHLPEVQNAIRAARESTDSAIGMARLINRLLKKADGKSNQGLWVPEAVDSLRSSLLFASAGLDTSLKRLVRHALASLASTDERVDNEFRTWAKKRIGDPTTGAVQAKELVDILLSSGRTPRDSLISTWISTLTAGSAQSAERVTELAQALGVTDSNLKRRFTPGKGGAPTTLQLAFAARNQIAHELDVTNPKAATRQPLEKIRKYRSESDMGEWCRELLDVTQSITNDVASRLAT